MKPSNGIALIACGLVLCGCSQDTTRRAPAAPGPLLPTGDAVIWGMIVDRTGWCIPGATVQVIEGELTGRSEVQRTPCDVWAFDGGFFFRDLRDDRPMMLRLSAEGYEALELTVRPTGLPYTVTAFTLKPR